MIRATKSTIIKWIKITEVVDCSRNVCPCGDKLRRLLVTRPTSRYDEKNIINLIKSQEFKYNKCFKDF